MNKFNNLGLSKAEFKNLRYQNRCNLLNKNPVPVARNFQYKVQMFFKELLLDGSLEKNKYFALSIDF